MPVNAPTNLGDLEWPSTSYWLSCSKDLSDVTYCYQYANQRTIACWNKELFCLTFYNVCKQISSLFCCKIEIHTKIFLVGSEYITSFGAEIGRVNFPDFLFSRIYSMKIGVLHLSGCQESFLFSSEQFTCSPLPLELACFWWVCMLASLCGCL